MARARLLKPGFFANEKLAKLNPFARLLFAGLWTISDREGRLRDAPKYINGLVFPYENVAVDRLLKELDKAGFVKRYEVDGEHYLQIVTFERHQQPHFREAASTIPPPIDLQPSLGLSLGPKPGPSPRRSPVQSPAVTCDLYPVSDPVSDPVTVTVPPPSSLVDPIDQIAADFAGFGKVTAGTAQAIAYSVMDFSQEWVQKAVRVASGANIDGQPPWSFVESILERWKAQGGPDEPRATTGKHVQEVGRYAARNGQGSAGSTDGAGGWGDYAAGPAVP